MTRQSRILTDTFGEKLTNLRISKELSQAKVAAAAGISTGYYCAIEGDNRLPPPTKTLVRILKALAISDSETKALLEMAAIERKHFTQDINLPEQIQALIADLRRYGRVLPSDFVKALRTDVREAIN